MYKCIVSFFLFIFSITLYAEESYTLQAIIPPKYTTSLPLALDNQGNVYGETYNNPYKYVDFVWNEADGYKISKDKKIKIPKENTKPSKSGIKIDGENYAVDKAALEKAVNEYLVKKYGEEVKLDSVDNIFFAANSKKIALGDILVEFTNTKANENNVRDSDIITVLWDIPQNTFTTIDMEPDSINDNNQVLGYKERQNDKENEYGFNLVLYDKGEFKEIGSEYEFYSASLNNEGVVFGTSFDKLLWFTWKDGKITYIKPKEIVNGKDWQLLETTQINDNGEMLGTGYSKKGNEAAILLKPLPKETQ